MDFSVINDFSLKVAPAPRMISLILAETGSLHHFPANKFFSPIEVKKAPFLIDLIEKEFGISQSDQVILRSEDGKQLESSMDLEEYFQSDKTIYVYIAKGKRVKGIQEDFEVIGGLSLEKKWSESCMQFLPSIYENFLGSNMRDYLESEILGAYDNLLMLFSDVKNDLNALREGMNKVSRQKEAEKVAKKNLLNYNLEKKHHFDEILSEQESKITSFQERIGKFDSYIEKLSKQEVDPQLADENVRYLINYFDLEKLKKSKALSEKNQEKIKQKASELKEEIQDYDTQLKNIEDVLIDYSSDLQQSLQEQEGMFANVQDLNLKEFKNMIEFTKGNPSQIDLGTFVRRENETTVPKLKQICSTLKEIKERLEGYLKENSIKLKALISDIKSIRELIKGRIHSKLKVFCALVAKHEEGMFNLEILEKFPSVYQQSTNEIKRRLVFKKDYMTMLTILESFGSAENRSRHEFLEANQRYLPKKFCPFLSKAFPHIKVNSIRKALDQDLNFSMNDAIQSFVKPSSEADILKLLKNLHESLEAKEGKNMKLEETIKSLKKENEALCDQVREKGLNVANMRNLLGATGFTDKMEDFLGVYKVKLLEKVENMEKKLQEIQSEKLKAMQEFIRSSNEQVERKKEEFLAKEAEFEKVKEEYNQKIASINASLQEKEELLKEISMKYEDIQQKLEEAKNESIALREQKSLKEKEVCRLGEQIKRFERQEEDSQQSKEKQVEDLKKDLKNFEDELIVRENMLSKSKQTVEELKLKKDNLENYVRDLTAKLNAANDAKQKALKQVESFELEREASKSEAKKLKEAHESRDKEIKLKEKDIEELRGSLEALKREKEEQRKLLAKEKTSSDENTKKEIERFKILLANKEEEINQIKKIIKEKEKKIKQMEESLSEKESQNINLNEITKAQRAEIDKLSEAIHDKLSKEEPLQDMIQEIGSLIMTTYVSVFGEEGQQKMQTQEIEIKDLLIEIFQLLQDPAFKVKAGNLAVKVGELNVGDKIVAFKIKNLHHYLVVRSDMNQDNVLVIYTDKRSELKGASIIMGDIRSFGNYETDTITRKYEALIQIELENIKTIVGNLEKELK